jgi:UDP-N-acetylmuramoyl-L-alanyl-D-glutamate--2,6-diaminopimelate ligase
MESYFRAKKLLFDSLPSDAVAVTNADDPRGREIVSTTDAHRITYGNSPGSDYLAKKVSLSIDGIRMTVAQGKKEEEIASELIGSFNAANILASFAACSSLGINSATIVQGISRLKGVRGRFEQVSSPDGWVAIIDYAHTPDALENCLRTVKDILRGGKASVITIFGCGGDRDRGKRPIMGKIASSLSNTTIITSDNPRSENPDSIISEIKRGCVSGSTVFEEPDRRKAIGLGLKMARPGDVVLITGKGHETYQIVGDRREHFDDREEVERLIHERPVR